MKFCFHITRRLSAYCEGEAPAGERARIEAHLELCADCRSRSEQIRKNMLLMRQAPLQDPDDELWDVISRELSSGRSPEPAGAAPSGRRLGFGKVRLLRPAATVIALVLIASALLLASRYGLLQGGHQGELNLAGYLDLVGTVAAEPALREFPAAPQIGCGSRAKPFLQELRHHGAVSEAWLNRPGNVIAVIWAKDSTPAARAEAITTIEKNRDLTMSELNGEKRETALKEFAAKANWYRASEVARLSEDEADIIAARLVQRARATVTLSDKHADELEKAIAAACKRTLIDAVKAPGQSRENELLGAGCDHLSEEGMAALKQALSLGYRPLPGEK